MRGLIIAGAIAVLVPAVFLLVALHSIISLIGAAAGAR